MHDLNRVTPAQLRAGRALVGYLSPARRRAEVFGRWGLAVKLASLRGPITYGAVTWMSGADHRLAMLVTGGFFVLGLLVLKGIDVERGRRAALDEEQNLQSAQTVADNDRTVTDY